MLVELERSPGGGLVVKNKSLFTSTGAVSKTAVRAAREISISYPWALGFVL
jgi:hypothetical protein